ncbi:AzlD domain-containing protein [Nocardioides sp. cx-169]|uniref:AzlD domain-containing protein n=1 Tax=Nocardioides sp. cx-169 TaxID=2899080 RepID=UPI001E2D61DF|nr:AzlD domain-containing protein [Nocardioides sp. cx-169]MCD4536397.1 AzlD domain-containing protein [Nocardioides sp. cx-169]
MTVWLLIGGMAVLTAMIKAAGPVLLGGRELPAKAMGVVALMPPVLLTALVVTSTLSDGRRITVDASVVGVAAGALLLWRRCPLVIAVLVAAGVTALVRALA